MAVNIPILGPQNAQTSIGVAFPFAESNSGGIFATTITTADAIKGDLLAFLTTPQYAIRMNNEQYSPLPGFVFEQTDDMSLDNLQTLLTKKINQFFPDIVLQEIIFNFNPQTNVLEVIVPYSIPSLGISQDSVAVSLQMAS